MYNLAKQALARKLVAGAGVITCMAVHPGGDHLIVGSEDRRLWCGRRPPPLRRPLHRRRRLPQRLARCMLPPPALSAAAAPACAQAPLAEPVAPRPAPLARRLHPPSAPNAPHHVPSPPPPAGSTWT